jgi:hypothetical protein
MLKERKEGTGKGKTPQKGSNAQEERLTCPAVATAVKDKEGKKENQ